MNAQQLINTCDQLADHDRFVKGLRTAEWLAENRDTIKASEEAYFEFNNLNKIEKVE